MIILRDRTNISIFSIRALVPDHKAKVIKGNYQKAVSQRAQKGLYFEIQLCVLIEFGVIENSKLSRS